MPRRLITSPILALTVAVGLTAQADAQARPPITAGEADFGKAPSTWGNWIADVERPAGQYRGRYQPRLQEARGLPTRKT